MNTNPKTLLYLTNTVFPSRSANSLQVLKMSRAFEDNGYKVSIVGYRANFKKISTNQSMNLIFYPFKFCSNKILKVYAVMVLFSKRPSLVYTRNPSLALLSCKFGFTTFLELHGLPIKTSLRYRDLSNVLENKNLVKIISISQRLSLDLLEEFKGLPFGHKGLVAHDGADLDIDATLSTNKSSIIRVGYFGQLYPGKGMEIIFQLSALLPNVQFDVYGGTSKDIIYWKSKCASCQNVVINGYIANDSVIEKMKKCDILIAPYLSSVSHSGSGDISRWMSPLKLFEYMSAKRPIIATDLPVIREVLSDGETALLCKAEDADSFASAIKKLANDGQLRYRLALSAHKLLQTKYTWNQRASKILRNI